MAIALVLVLVVVGSVLFHVLSPWWWTPIASNWGYIDSTIVITFWITGAVFSAVVLFMAYCVYRFRHKEGQKAAYEPENKRLESWLTAITAIGVAAMLAPGLYVWKQFVTVPGCDRGRGRCPAMAVELPAARRRRQARHLRHAALSAPTTRSASIPTIPNGQDDIVVEAADLHLPIGKPVKMLLRSVDVLHDFYVPEFRAKMDMVPGMP
jgi:cytochrome c oxidase subunit 2